MKKCLVLFALLLLAAGLTANPVIARLIARAWFNDANEFLVVFGEETQMYAPLPQLSFSTSAGTYFFPDGYTMPVYFPCQINLSQVIPGFTIQREDDFFRLNLDAYSEILNCGPEVDLVNDMHALSPGQRAVQTRVASVAGWQYNVWAKDLIQPSPDLYEPSVGYTLNLHVQTTDGAPAPDVPIYLSFTAGLPTNYTTLATNAQGDWQLNASAVRTRLQINDPLTNNPVLEEIIFPEPGATIQLNATVSGVAVSDPLLPEGSGQLLLSPSLLNSATGYTVSLKYGREDSFAGTAELRLFDLRGRVLASAEMPAGGETQWRLPDLPSGIYFIALEQGSRQLGRGRITIIK